MARTPLFGQLLRMLQIARRARHEGVPAAELAERETLARTLRRRQFLGIAAAAPLVIAGCGDDGGTTPPPAAAKEVVVVGAGIAGLHAAYRLDRLGVKARVFDANKRVGGRMFTDRTTFPDGMHCELGGELIDTGHQTMRDLATELEIPLYDYSTDDPMLKRLVAHVGGSALTDQEILDGFTPIAAAIDAAIAMLTDQEDLWVYYDNPNGGAALDKMSIAEWLDAAGATGPVRKLLEVAYIIEYGVELDKSNALNLLLLISTDTTDFQIFGDSDELFHTKTGNDTYPQKLAAALGDRVELETALVSIKEASDGRYALTFQKAGSTVAVTADHVVLALPFSILRDLDVQLDLPAPKKAAIAELGYGTNAKLMNGFSSKPWRTTGKSDGTMFTDLAIQATWETSRLQPGTSGIITGYTGGQAGIDVGMGSPQDQSALFLTDFDTVFPGSKAASNGKVARMHWPTYPLTKGSYSAYLVGQYTKFSGAEVERFKNVHFAGEHTSIDAQGYMEGGALTGAMAAAEIAADLGIKTQTMSVAPAAGMREGSPSARIWTRANAALEHRRWRTALARSSRRKAG